MIIPLQSSDLSNFNIELSLGFGDISPLVNKSFVSSESRIITITLEFVLTILNPYTSKSRIQAKWGSSINC